MTKMLNVFDYVDQLRRILENIENMYDEDKSELSELEMYSADACDYYFETQLSSLRTLITKMEIDYIKDPKQHELTAFKDSIVDVEDGIIYFDVTEED